MGTLYLGNKLGAEAFTEEDQWAIDLLAAHAGVALHRARLQYILESAPHSMVVVEAETEHLMLNAQAVDLFGRRLAPEAGPAQLVGAICRPDGRPLPLEEFPSTRVQHGQAIRDEELLIVRPDGGRVPVLVSAAPVRSPWLGHAADVVMVFQDISLLKELERLREEWTFIIAHDLRQPITVIAGHAARLQRLIQQYARTEQEVRAVEHIRAAAGSLNRMIGDLLDASRIETRRLALERQRVDLRALICQVVERLQQVTRGHPVRVEVEETIPPVEADPTRIEQVLGNLLSNAANYGYPETEIRVEVGCRDGQVEVAVTNRGEGIPAEELPHLFTRFYRAEQSRRRRDVGLGLGLYLSKGLVEAHGGRIWAESTPGEITTFRFRLPAAEGPGDRY
ncbi:MAG: PAS domain S-box protein [Chloroflexi bacterium]|nr:PAS domain S-box protein [Chloroflexota bacterium]